MSSTNEIPSYRDDIQSTLIINERLEYEEEALGALSVFGLCGEGFFMPACAWQLSKFVIDGQSQNSRYEQIRQTVCHAGAHFPPHIVPYATDDGARDDEHGTASAAANIREVQGGHVFPQPGENHTHQPQHNNASTGSTSIGKTNAMALHQCESLTGYKLTTQQHHLLDCMSFALSATNTGSENVGSTPSSSIATTSPHRLSFFPAPLSTPSIEFAQYISPVSTAYNPPRMPENSTDFEGATNLTTTPSSQQAQSHGPMRFYAEQTHTKRRIQLERWANETDDLSMTVCALTLHQKIMLTTDVNSDNRTSREIQLDLLSSRCFEGGSCIYGEACRYSSILRVVLELKEKGPLLSRVEGLRNRENRRGLL
jgi:hypothetical protein